MKTLDPDKLSIIREAAKLWSFLINLDIQQYENMLPKDVLQQLHEFSWLVLPKRHPSYSYLSYLNQLETSAEHTLRYVLREDSNVAGTTYRHLWTIVKQLDISSFDELMHPVLPAATDIKVELDYAIPDVLNDGDNFAEHNPAIVDKTDNASATTDAVDDDDILIAIHLKSSPQCVDNNTASADGTGGTAENDLPVIGNVSSSNDHRAIHHQSSRNSSRKRCYKCTECNGKSFANKGSLVRHLRLHSGEKPFQCVVCGKSFTCSGNRDKHQRRRHAPPTSPADVVTLPCSTCGKSFTDRDYLRTHERMHELSPGGHKNTSASPGLASPTADVGNFFDGTNGPPYRCAVCCREFLYRSTLAEHAKCHLDVRPFQCETCGKSFKWAGDLTVHVRSTHSGPKQRFACPECGQQLSSKAGLVRHTRVHTQEKPYLCMECGRSFGGYSNHRKHLKVHAREKAAFAAAAAAAAVAAANISPDLLDTSLLNDDKTGV